MDTFPSDVSTRFLSGRFGSDIVSTLLEKDFSQEYAEEFAVDLLFVDWPGNKNEEEELLAQEVIGIDTEGMIAFEDTDRIKDGWEALLNHRYVSDEAAKRASGQFWAEMPNINPTALILDIVEKHFQASLEDTTSYDYLLAYWHAHGMGYEPHRLYPYYSQTAHIPEAVQSALTAASTVHPLDETTYPVPLAVDAVHDIYTGLFWQSDNIVDVVAEVFREGIAEYAPQQARAETVKKMSRHAICTFWEVLGFEVDDNGEPMPPE